MKSIKYYKTVAKLHLRENLNYVFGPIRRRFIGTNSRFTIISNNCWGGHVYRYFRIPYMSPTVGSYMFSEDYIKFVKNLRHYTSMPISFITYKESRYCDILMQRGGDNIKCPIGRIDDIEIVFLHYKTPEEAQQKWTRRCSRIVWDHLYFKMSEQNLCNYEYLKEFDSLQYEGKLLFVHKDYGLKSQIIWKEFLNDSEVLNDTNSFRKYINLIKWINRKPKYLK